MTLASSAPAPGSDGVAPVAGTLARAGLRCWLVGDGALALAQGRPLTRAALWIEGSYERVLEALPAAVAVAPGAGRALLPGLLGGIDLQCCRFPEAPHGDLARRAFTREAVALDLAKGEWLDPSGGLADEAAGRLRCPGDAERRLAEEPLRALRAAVLVARHGLACDPDLTRALAAAAPRVGRLPGRAVGDELERMLRAPDPAAGVALLRSCGIEALWIGAVRPDAARVLAALCRRDSSAGLVLRWAAWLRGSAAGAVLARLRRGEPGRSRVSRLLALHPLEDHVRGAPAAALARLERRLGREGLDALFALRRAELDDAPATAASEELGRLDRARDRARDQAEREAARARLALDGAAVMRILDCAAGPAVGRALAELSRHVEAHPEDNDPESLERWLVRRARGDAR